MVTTFNIFIPLNSVDWLNSKIFTKNPLKNPLISHPTILIFLAMFTLSVVFYIAFFVREKTVKREIDFGILKIFTKNFPEMLTNKYNLWLMFFIVITNIAHSFFRAPTNFTFVKEGMTKTDLTNISTLTLIPQILAVIFSSYFIQNGKLVTYYEYLSIYGVILSSMYYATVIYLKNTDDTSTTFYVHLIINLIGVPFSTQFNFLMPFLTQIADERIGGTAITMFTSIMNASEIIPSTIGLKIAANVPYVVYGAVVVVLMFFTVVPFYWMALWLD